MSNVVALNTVNAQRALSQQTVTVAAENSPAPIIYGRRQIGGRIFALDYTAGTWTIGVLFCLGEIEAVEQLYLNGETPAAGTTVTYYTGTTTQTTDATLAAAIAGYADDLVITTPQGDIGVAYAVVQYASSVYPNFPSFIGEISGKKVWNPDTSTTIYSKNPSLQLADLISSTIYGDGMTVDDTQLSTAAAANDALVLGEKRRESGLIIDKPMTTPAWIEILRTYASVFVANRNGIVFLVPDRPASVDKVLTAANVVAGSLKIKKLDSSSLPTVVRVKYADTVPVIWTEREGDAAKLAGVDAGTTERREQLIRLSGIDRHSQATREAVERLNKLQAADLSVSFLMFDEALELEAGDIIQFSHKYGLTNKTFRLPVDPRPVRPGRWAIIGDEYDATVYDDTSVTDAGGTDPNIVAPGPPTAVVGLVLTEEGFQLQNGEYGARVKISWTLHTDPFVTGYLVEVLEGGVPKYSGETRSLELATPALAEDVLYTVTVQAITPVYTGTAGSDTITLTGKFAVPTGPTSLSGFEVAGDVRLTWPADTSDFDIKRYEIRYGTTSDTWATAIFLDVVDALRFQTRDVSPGTWRFFVKSIDSVKQESTNSAYKDIVVTSDDDAFLVDEHTFATGSQTYLHASVESRLVADTTYYSDGGDSWSTLFGGAAMSTFTNPLASYQTAIGTSEWLSDEFDAAVDITGDWISTLIYTDLTGTATPELGLKPDAGSYTYGVLSRKGTARYAKGRLQSAGIFMLVVPGPDLQINAVGRSESGSDTSSASVATTITLDNDYSTVKSIVLTPDGTTALTAVVDNIDLASDPNTFDVYIFNAAGTQVANAFYWAFEGI